MLLILLLAVLGIHTPAQNADEVWPGWRGADGSGVASGSPPVTWSEEENLRWRTELPGKGVSSPVVWGDRVYVTTAIAAEAPEQGEDEDGEGDAEPETPPGGDAGGAPHGRPGGWRGFGHSAPIVEQTFMVIALDRASGEVVWSKTVHEQLPHQGAHSDGSFASPTIATDGEVVLASFGSFGIYALDRDGEVLWARDLGDLDISGSFGEGSSPVLADDLLVHNWDHTGESFIVALDKRTGEERWRTARPGGTSWVTPLVVRGEERTQVVVASTQTIAYDLTTGEELWRHGEPTPPAGGEGGGGRGRGGSFGGGRGGGHPGGFGGGGGPMASAVQHGGLLLVMAGGRGRGKFQALRAERPADAAEDYDPVVWTREAETPRIPSPIVVDGLLYALRSNSGILTTFDVETGEVVMGPERMSGLQDAYASPVAAGGHLYFAGRDGTVEVVKAGREFESVAVNHLDDGFDASPAIVGDELFLRGRKALYCIAGSAPQKRRDL